MAEAVGRLRWGWWELLRVDTVEEDADVEVVWVVEEEDDAVLILLALEV